jgi:hypothetical protein
MSLAHFRTGIFAIVLLSPVLDAQTVGGRILGDSSQHPLASVRVVLVDSALRRDVDSTTSDTSGVFYTNAPAAGAYFLRFERSDAMFRYSPTWRLASNAFQQGTFIFARRH